MIAREARESTRLRKAALLLHCAPAWTRATIDLYRNYLGIRQRFGEYPAAVKFIIYGGSLARHYRGTSSPRLHIDHMNGNPGPSAIILNASLSDTMKPYR